MFRGLVWLAAGCVLAMAALYTWAHRSQLAESVAVPKTAVATEKSDSAADESAGNAESPEEKEAKSLVTVAGPLAQYISGGNSEDSETKESSGSSENRCSSPSCKPGEMDRVIGESPVGTSTPILRKTFEVAGLVSVPFEVPAHSANPQLHGKYRSFLPKGLVAVDETSADVEFLLLNQEQYETLMDGKESDVVFSAADSHDQEVTTNLGPTFAEPVRYYLVFRNSSRANGKKLVKANFRVDF